MLQVNKPVILPEQLVAQPNGVSPAEIVGWAVGFARRQYATVLVIAALLMALAALYVLSTPPSFTAEAMLMLDTRKVQLLQQQSVLGDIQADSATVDSQVEVIKSEKVALAVIKELKLTEDPEFVGTGGGLVRILIGSVMSLLSSPTESTTSEFELVRAAMSVLHSRLMVRRLALTYVIEINYRSYSPQRAAQIANAIADAYIVDALEAKYQATRRASLWLQDRISELREQASAAERAVIVYKEKNNMVDAGGRLLSEQQLAELSSQSIAARALTAETKARLDRIEEIIHSADPAATVTDTLKNDVITKLRQQYLDFSNRVGDLSRRYGANHLAVVNMRSQMNEIRRSIIDELQRIAETYKSDYEIAKTREEAVKTGLNAIVSESQVTNRAQVELRELESTAQTYRALHDNFLQRYMESVQQQSFPITEARVITEATPPLRKSHPRSLLIVAVATVFGGILGFGAGLLRELTDRVFRTSGQIEATLHRDCIAVVPAVKTSSILDPESERAFEASQFGGRIIRRDDGPCWNVLEAPFSRYAESVRAIKVAADLYGMSRPNRVIGITSSLPNEGKSTLATTLALLIAHTGARVILVDADLRNPDLSRGLSPEADAGLLEVIAGRMPLEAVLWMEPSTGLVFLPTVTRSRLAHTSEILSADPTRQLLTRLREHYDYVIVDLSPLAPVVDVRTTAGLIDSYVFVVEWGRTKIDVVEHALRNAPGVYDNLLGVTLNKANMRVLARYDTYRGTYYRNRRFARYGYSD
jgi:succinoglycan biosynthesis transport protein ExoP